MEIKRVTTQWLLIDCAHQGEVRISHCAPHAAPALHQIYRYDSSIPTFTDVLLQFEKDSGSRLADLEPVVAIAGVPSAQSLIVERSRWVISRAGLQSMFGRPVTIINEVAAQAWALRGSLQGVTPLRGQGSPELMRRGRFLFITYEEGVGTAIIDIDDRGRCTVLEAEGGQIDFMPADDIERALVQAIPGLGPIRSWEQVLMARREDSGSDRLSLSPTDRNRLFAALLGRFISNLVYTSGAWDGTFITGKLIPHIEPVIADFERGLTFRRPYHRLLGETKCWRVAQNEAVLKGCAAMQVSRHGLDAPSPTANI